MEIILLRKERLGDQGKHVAADIGRNPGTADRLHPGFVDELPLAIAAAGGQQLVGHQGQHRNPPLKSAGTHGRRCSRGVRTSTGHFSAAAQLGTPGLRLTVAVSNGARRGVGVGGG